ncbi:MAG TPA: dihydrolipoamide acetyltransferase family protein [Trebonia sp.]|nr:dihydrolipoamide acetyltransferase family protein [Trebonia sp.]
MPDFLLPDLGEGLGEAEVVAWHVKAGDRVAVDQVIAEVETAKAVVEVPVPYAGIVAALHAEPGTTVSVGQPLITVTADGAVAGLREPGIVVPEREAGGSAVSEQAVSGLAIGGQAVSGQAVSAEEGSGSVLIGYGTGSVTGTAPARTRRGRRRAAAPPLAAPGRLGRVAVVSPLVRKEARDAGLNLSSLAGTGPGGVVSRGDVRQAIASRTRPQLAATGERRIPLRGARRAAADKLSRSRREIPEATVWVDVDATGLMETRRALNTADPARPVSLLALVARFAVLGLRRYPELNARIEQDEIVVPERVNLGFAAQTDHGLVVPVVPDAHRLSARDLSARLAELTSAARERRLAPADLAGGTFTVNNYGVFGVDGSAAIINHPEVAILGLGRVIDRPWVVDGQLAVRKVTELTLAFDHRACDGGTAGGFLRYVADCVESPATALGDM